MFFVSNACVPILIRDLFLIVIEKVHGNVIDENQTNMENNENVKDTSITENIIQTHRQNNIIKLKAGRSHDIENKVCNYKNNNEDNSAKHFIVHNPTDDENTNYDNEMAKQLRLNPYMPSLMLVIYLIEISTVLVMGFSVMMNQTMIMILPLLVGAVFTIITALIPQFVIGMAVAVLVEKAKHVDIRIVDFTFFHF